MMMATLNQVSVGAYGIVKPVKVYTVYCHNSTHLLTFSPGFTDVFLTQFSALQTSRSVRTRRLAAAEENTEVTRTARLAHIFKEICDMITSYKGELV